MDFTTHMSNVDKAILEADELEAYSERNETEHLFQWNHCVDAFHHAMKNGHDLDALRRKYVAFLSSDNA